MSLLVTFADGSGEVLSFEGENLHCALTRAFAPGAPLSFTVDVGAEQPLSLAGKARASKRQPDGRFTVHLRLISLRRVQREALERALQG